MPILKVSKLRLREMGRFAQDHKTAGALNSSVLSPSVGLLSRPSPVVPAPKGM